MHARQGSNELRRKMLDRTQLLLWGYTARIAAHCGFRKALSAVVPEALLFGGAFRNHHKISDAKMNTAKCRANYLGHLRLLGH
jgi:hypothetical protein